MVRLRRTPLAVLAVLLLSAASVSASRELLQLGLGKGKGKGAVPVQPLSIVSNAAYVQPTLLPMSNEPVYQPAAVLPLDQIKDKIAQVKSSVTSMFTPKPAPAVQPVYVQQAPVAMAPIYASGRALPAAQPYLIVPKYKWYDFPLIKSVLSLGITTVKTPDPPYVAPQYKPDDKKAFFSNIVGNALNSGGFEAGPAPGSGGGGPVPAGGAAMQYGGVQQMGTSGPVAAVPFGLTQAQPTAVAAPKQNMVVVSSQPQQQMLMQPGAAYVQAQQAYQGAPGSHTQPQQLYGQALGGQQQANPYPAAQQHTFQAPSQPIANQAAFATGSIAPMYG